MTSKEANHFPLFLHESRFKFDRPIGKGGMGEVALYIDVSNGTTVTVKIEKKPGGTHMANEITFYTRFAQSMEENKTNERRRRIKSVPKYVIHGKLEDGRSYIVTEYVGEKTLHQYVKEKAGSDQSLEKLALATFNVIPHVIDQLHELHSFYLIHRDIKP